ncbi:thylakoid lumenal 16.5 kDa protein, chloroplastic isoform 1 [Corchorus capsularis]|uniref:Thylakoid lumenal 16.5 kDa protein, chloroplastic isoform 1 n=1 Tax=Corchorus capsularis TaxID=210143 RepID=A0A1R3IEZ3_COCAP|nr:thylakoid lumenal 16.5 kDa protein, chloroplastic isoform 1 [Corchorus capsularis]
MAAAFLSTANSFLSPTLTPSTSSSCCSSSSSSSISLIYLNNQNARRRQTLCKAFNETQQPTPALTKRGFSLCLITSLVLAGNNGNSFNANAAILEADDDVELLEKVKQDRKKRLERQGVINSSAKEKGYLQELVYKLSKIGQAIENNDLSTAGSVLGGSTDTDWVKNANIAFNKLSSSPEEKDMVETFNSSLASLISSVTKNDIESSKVAFVVSASAFEKWTTLTGLFGQLKGL